jgi:hypothetical protein
MFRKTLITAMIMCIVVTSAAVYTMAQQNQNNTDIDEIAIDFLVNGPTFAFDGIMDSIEIIERYDLESYPVQHVIVISFETAHAGWGDREGTFVAQVITPHIIRITIVEGEVVDAVIDEKWDEINQTQITPEELLLPENARDQALEYIIVNYPDLGFDVPDVWISEAHNPSGLLGSSTMRYFSKGWNVTVRYPVIQYPDFEVEIHYTGETEFLWQGTVYNEGTVMENSMQK